MNVTDWVIDVAMKLGVPTLAFILAARFISRQDDRRQDREDRNLGHMIDADNRRAAQVDAMLGLHRETAANERVQANAMQATSLTLAKLEETTKQLVGHQGERGPQGATGPRGERGLA